jgi:hypothetical protein
VTTLLDNLVSGSGATYLDNLTQGAGTVHTQAADAIVILSGGAVQSYDGISEQEVNVILQLYAGARQELIEPVGPQGYLQSGNFQVILFAGGAQEHAPPQAGQYGQGGDVVLVLSGGAIQAHVGGSSPGDHLQTGDFVLILSGGASHSYEPIVSSSVGQATVVEILPYKAEDPVVAQLDVSAGVTLVGRIEISVQSGSTFFQTGVGPLGGQSFVEVALRANGQRVPLVSLRQGRNVAIFSSADVNPTRFSLLSQAVAAGPIDLELGAYEVVSGRVRPFVMPATAEVNLVVGP